MYHYRLISPMNVTLIIMNEKRVSGQFKGLLIQFSVIHLADIVVIKDIGCKDSRRFHTIFLRIARNLQRCRPAAEARAPAASGFIDFSASVFENSGVQFCHVPCSADLYRSGTPLGQGA
jgi:hypothetical protein